MSQSSYTEEHDGEMDREDKERFERLAEHFEDDDPEFSELCSRLAQSIEVSRS